MASTGPLLLTFTKKKKSMFNDDLAFDSLPCYFHQTLYEFNMLAVST